MGRPEKAERNRGVIADHRAGVSVKELKAKYGISHQRIYQIIRASKAAYDVSSLRTATSASWYTEVAPRGMTPDEIAQMARDIVDGHIAVVSPPTITAYSAPTDTIMDTTECPIHHRVWPCLPCKMEGRPQPAPRNDFSNTGRIQSPRVVGPHIHVFDRLAPNGHSYVSRCGMCGSEWPEGGLYAPTCVPTTTSEKIPTQFSDMRHVAPCVVTPDMSEPDA